MVGSVDVDGQDQRDPVRLLTWVGPVVLLEMEPGVERVTLAHVQQAVRKTGRIPSFRALQND